MPTSERTNTGTMRSRSARPGVALLGLLTVLAVCAPVALGDIGSPVLESCQLGGEPKIRIVKARVLWHGRVHWYTCEERIETTKYDCPTDASGTTTPIRRATTTRFDTDGDRCRTHHNTKTYDHSYRFALASNGTAQGTYPKDPCPGGIQETTTLKLADGWVQLIENGSHPFWNCDFCEQKATLWYNIHLDSYSDIHEHAYDVIFEGAATVVETGNESLVVALDQPWGYRLKKRIKVCGCGEELYTTDQDYLLFVALSETGNFTLGSGPASANLTDSLSARTWRSFVDVSKEIREDERRRLDEFKRCIRQEMVATKNGRLNEIHEALLKTNQTTINNRAYMDDRFAQIVDALGQMNRTILSSTAIQDGRLNEIHEALLKTNQTTLANRAYQDDRTAKNMDVLGEMNRTILSSTAIQDGRLDEIHEALLKINQTTLNNRAYINGRFAEILDLIGHLITALSPSVS